MINMRKLNLALATLIGAAVFSGCTLSKMIKLASEQDLTVDPNPLEVHGGTVSYNMSAVLPPKMLPSGKVYTIKNFYQYGDQEMEVGEIEFQADDFPNSSSSTSRKAKDFEFEYSADLNPGKLMVQGIAKDPRNGKTAESPKMEVAVGIITTSMMVKDVYASDAGSYADHGYNDDEELIPTNINFYFEQGRSVLQPGLEVEGGTNRSKQQDLSAFIAEKNVTKTVTITGTHSPEGPERINSNLSQERAERIEEYYRRQMNRYDYKGMADSIKFILKPVVEDWSAFKAALRNYDGISDDSKRKMTQIVDGNGTFEDKEKQLRTVDGYDDVFDDIYPGLRSAKTEILTVKEKKSNAEISVLAKGIVDGSVSADTLSNEELLFAATLTPSLDEKEGIFMAATKKSGSWVAHNNLAAVYLEKAKADAENRDQLVQDAITQLEIASNKESNKPEIMINMASAYMMQGEYDKSYDALTSAESNATNAQKSDINAMKGAIEIRRGEYEDARASLASARSGEVVAFNRGLVNLLLDDYDNAQSSLDDASEAEAIAADSYYLKAVTAARQKSVDGVVKNLTEAIKLNSDLKDKALNDLEFVNFADAVAQTVR
jgi:tetratricopeptide (TPR) repeat protein